MGMPVTGPTFCCSSSHVASDWPISFSYKDMEAFNRSPSWPDLDLSLLLCSGSS